MDSILVKPARQASGKPPAVLLQHGGGQTMATYIGDAILLANKNKESRKAPVNATAWWILSWLSGGRSTGSGHAMTSTGIGLPTSDTAFSGNAGGVLTAVDKRIMELMRATDPDQFLPSFANVEASLDRLLWLQERLRLKGLAHTLGRTARQRR